MMIVNASISLNAPRVAAEQALVRATQREEKLEEIKNDFHLLILYKLNKRELSVCPYKKQRTIKQTSHCVPSTGIQKILSL